MLPRLRAEADLTAADIAMVPRMKDQNRKRWIRQRERIKDGGRRLGIVKPKSASDIEALGIPVIREERPDGR